MEQVDKAERFYKHRKNMLLISGIFIFLVLSGGSVESINILGSKLKFANPDIPVKILFIATTYMLIKYFQFLKELNGTGIKSQIDSLVTARVPYVAKALAEADADNSSGYSINDYQIMEIKESFTYIVKQNTANHVDGEAVKKIASAISNDYEISLKHLWKVYLMSFLRILITTTWFAEYVMPLFLTAIGLYMYLFADMHEIIWLISNE